MTSERRSNASRTNGALSRGPVTPEGKLAASRNSLRHGILSKTAVLADESSATFIELLASYQEEHRPQTPTEETLIENMAVARWRQLRLWNMETAGLDNQMRHPRFFDGEDFPAQAFIAFRTLTDETRALELLNRYEARYDRQFKSSLACFLSLRAGCGDPPSVDAKLFWTGDFGPELVADSSATPEPPELLAEGESLMVGSFGNSTFPAQSPPPEPPPIARIDTPAWIPDDESYADFE